MTIILATTINIAYGFGEGEQVTKLNVEGYKWQHQAMRGPDIYAMDKNGVIYEYEQKNGYEEKSYENHTIEGKLEAITVHENGTVYYMERRETKHYVVGCYLNGTTVYEKEIISNINKEDGTDILNMLITDHFLMINDADYELEIYDHNMNRIKNITLKDKGIEGSYTHGIAYDGKSYWLPTYVTNTYKTNNQARFYKINGDTGEVEASLEYEPIFTSVMSIYDEYLYYLVMEIEDYSETLYRVPIKDARAYAITTEASWKMSVSIVIGIVTGVIKNKKRNVMW